MTQPQSYAIEMLTGEQAVLLSATEDTGVEIAIDEPSVVKNTPGSTVVEVLADREVPWQIGGLDPVANPKILVWFDTQGA